MSVRIWDGSLLILRRRFERNPGPGVQLVVRGGREDFFVRWKQGPPSSIAAGVSVYNELKRRWDGRPHDSYRNAKSVFIEGQLELT